MKFKLQLRVHSIRFTMIVTKHYTAIKRCNFIIV